MWDGVKLCLWLRKLSTVEVIAIALSFFFTYPTVPSRTSRSRSRSRGHERRGRSQSHSPRRHSRSRSTGRYRSSRRSRSRSLNDSRSPRRQRRSYSRSRYDSRSPYRRSPSPSRRHESEDEASAVTDTFIRAVAAEVKGHGSEYEENLREWERNNPRYSFMTQRKVCQDLLSEDVDKLRKAPTARILQRSS